MVLQPFYMLGVVAPFPAIEGLWTDTKIAASETGIVVVGIVIVKPF
jgi:hypothetical protein